MSTAPQLPPKGFRAWWGRAARVTLDVTGSVWAFLVALAVIVAWAVTGPIFHFSDTWQLVINTGTTVVTFLMVFLIQHSQNRDTKALHIKLNELIAAVDGASNRLIDVEDLTEDELAMLHRQFQELRGKTEGAGPRSVEEVLPSVDPTLAALIHDEKDDAPASTGARAGRGSRTDRGRPS